MGQVVTNNNLNLNVMVLIPVLCYGGTEAQTLKLIRMLIESNCKVEVVCFYEYYPDVVEEYKKNGAKVTLLNHRRKNNKFSLFIKLFQKYRLYRPDVAHVQYVEQGFIALLSAWIAMVPVRFATVHQLGTFYGKFQRILLRTSALFTTVFLCVSQATERSWFGDSAEWKPIKFNKRRHWTVYNCADIERIKSISSHIDKDLLKIRYSIGEGPVIGIVGRISTEKGQSVLLKSLSIIEKSGYSAKLLIVGEDHMRDDFTNQVEMLGLKDSVILTGRLPIKEVYKLYSIMDVVAVPSRVEGFGLTALEAMAAGRPVVASRIGGLSEIIEDGQTGILVEPQNHRELASAIIKCLANIDYARQLGAAGYLRACAMYSLEKYEERINSLYKWATE
jgi:glycosyltransferase involved in cell wall biosynthesis